MHISALPALNDNYIWIIQQQQGAPAVVVDPGDAQPVFDWLASHQVELASLLVTHHHWDHTDGIEPLLQHYDVPVYGPRNSKFKAISHALEEGDTFTPAGLSQAFTVLETLGHTLDHISYVTDSAVFCGDTLFSAGCGRMFEGQPEQFHQSLQKLAKLPGATAVYAAHEYTLANLRFAAAAEPDNQAIHEATLAISELRAAGQPSLPSTIATELAINPFLRAESATAFAKLRQWKDKF